MSELNGRKCTLTLRRCLWSLLVTSHHLRRLPLSSAAFTAERSPALHNIPLPTSQFPVTWREINQNKQRSKSLTFSCHHKPWRYTIVRASNDDDELELPLAKNHNEKESIISDKNESTKTPGISSSPSPTLSTSILERFLSPRIDDPGLPLTDALLAQIVAPSLQIYWTIIAHAPSPSWLRPISSTYFGEAAALAPRGSLLAPTLIHGAGLAVCWLAGALAGRMYEQETFLLSKNKNKEDNSREVEPSETVSMYQTLFLRLFQSGAFATGLLIVSTQIDLLLEFKRYVQVGESEETDLRLLVAIVEVINDVFFEALVIGSWRLIHARFMSNPDNRSRRF